MIKKLVQSLSEKQLKQFASAISKERKHRKQERELTIKTITKNLAETLALSIQEVRRNETTNPPTFRKGENRFDR